MIKSALLAFVLFTGQSMAGFINMQWHQQMMAHINAQMAAMQRAIEAALRQANPNLNVKTGTQAENELKNSNSNHAGCGDFAAGMLCGFGQNGFTADTTSSAREEDYQAQQDGKAVTGLRQHNTVVFGGGGGGFGGFGGMFGGGVSFAAARTGGDALIVNDLSDEVWYCPYYYSYCWWYTVREVCMYTCSIYDEMEAASTNG